VKAGKPPEIAIDRFGGLDFLDAVDGAGMMPAVRRGRLLAAQLDQPMVIVIERPGEMRGGPPRHAGPDTGAIDYQHLLARRSQFISGRQARDPGTDDDDVRICSLDEGPQLRSDFHPGGSASLESHRATYRTVNRISLQKVPSWFPCHSSVRSTKRDSRAYAPRWPGGEWTC
jgi:hypothetical protein